MVFGWPDGWDISDEISIGISIIVGMVELELLFWDTAGIDKHVSPKVRGVNKISLDVGEVGAVVGSIDVAHCFLIDVDVD